MENNSDFKERKGLLVFFGIVKLLFGAVFFLIFLFTLFSLVALQNINTGSAQQVSAVSVLTGAVVYLIFAVLLIILGIGSIRKTRWARSLTLLFSWMTFIAGIIGTISMVFFIGNIVNNINSPALNNPNVIFFVKILMFAFIIFFLIIIPGVFILVYRGRNVIKTVQKYDPKERWTDRCPLPLLALCLVMLYGSVALPLVMISTGFVMPFFGIFLTGLPAAILIFLNSIICIYLAIHIYKLNIRSWYYTLYFSLFWVTSFIVTLMFNNYMNIYKHMNIPPAQLKAIENAGLLTNKNIIIMSITSFILYLIFLLYIKKFFKKNDNMARA